jgi:hypothetical protein
MRRRVFSPSLSRGGSGRGWGFNIKERAIVLDKPHPHPNLPPEGEGTFISGHCSAPEDPPLGPPRCSRAPQSFWGEARGCLSAASSARAQNYEECRVAHRAKASGCYFLLGPFFWTSKEEDFVVADETAIQFNIAVGDSRYLVGLHFIQPNLQQLRLCGHDD